MGYDMYFVTRPAGEAEAVAALREVVNAAVAVRDQLPREEGGRLNPDRAREVGYDAHEAYEGRTERYRHAQDQVMAALAEEAKAERSYFRLNVWGMGLFRDLMFNLGMAFEDEPHPEWPEVEDYGITYDDVRAVRYPEDYPDEVKALTTEDREKVDAFLAAQREVLSWHGKTDTPGIPLHKFGSNDGWLVVPAECEAAVKAWESYVADCGEAAAHAAISSRLGGRPVDRWLAWIEYLRGAARHGGFEVR